MTRLPTGTVTFLFTDVEGSTRLAQQRPDVFADLLEQQRELVRAAIDAHGGVEVGTEGDSVFAVFTVARRAVMAAVTAQRSLAAHAWPDGAAVRVRMGLHTGDASVVADNYVGLDVHRAARIMSAGHGGQILISDATSSLLGDTGEIDLDDLGLHRLKDLQKPEHLFQVRAADLATSFPALRSLDAFPNNLPVQLTRFIGREQDLAAVRRALDQSRLITLLGVGGTGKTRLALQIAAETMERFPDGIWLIELAPISDPVLVPDAIANAIDVRQPARAPIDVVTETLKPKRCLLVLDNCEHLQDAVASLCDALLRRCPQVRIIATSREALTVAGEVTYRVPPLALPPGDVSLSPERAAQFPAVQLFAERAAHHKPGFRATDQNVNAIVQICRRLDGIPLAIELAAARVKVLSVEQIAARLDDRFRLLTAGFRTGLPHHQTLRAAMDWGHELLADDERALFRRLAVFSGGWTLEAAEKVCAGDRLDEGNVLDLLSRLVDKSLILVEDAPDGDVRYRFLETIRLYALERLVESGETETVRWRHQAVFGDLAEQAEMYLHGPEQKTWLNRLDTEHDNLRSALSWTMTAPDGAEAALRMAGSLSRFWEVRSYWTEARRWLHDALERGKDASPEARVKAMNGAAMLALLLHDYREAGALAQKSLELAHQIGDKRGEARCLVVLGIQACHLQNFGQAKELSTESMNLSRQIGDNWGTAWARLILAFVAQGQGDLESARRLMEETGESLRSIDHPWGQAIVQQALGMIAKDQGDNARARELLDDALVRFEALGDRGYVSYTQLTLGTLAMLMGDYGVAESRLVSTLRLRRDLGDSRGIATVLAALGAVASYRGDHSRAARLFGAAAARRDQTGATLPPWLRKSHDDRVAATTQHLGEAAFGAEWIAGQALPEGQMIVYALRDDAAVPEPTATGA
jgi:predicted ATPase/class 3 adenylate cyclase